MYKYIIRRVLYVIPVLLLVSIMVFSLIHMIPGDPIRMMIGPSATQEQIDTLREHYNLDKPVVVQYFLWLKDIVRGDLGISVRSKLPVSELIFLRMPVTLSLAIISITIGLIFSTFLGILAASKRNTIFDFSAIAFGVLGISIPSFWMGIMVILLFSLILGILPSIGYVSLFQDPVEYIRHLILPSFSLALPVSGFFVRMIRSQMLEVLNENYIRTARAKGLREVMVLYKHTLKNAAIPIVTIVGIEFAYLMGGTVIIEQIFALPGIGRLAIQSIFDRDYPITQGVVLIVAVTFVFINLIVDILYRFFNPKIKYE